MPFLKRVAVAATAAALLGLAARTQPQYLGTFHMTVPSGPFLPGSRLPLDASGVAGPLTFSLLGPGTIANGAFVVPANADGDATIIAATSGAVALSTVDLVSAPSPRRPLLAVASYDSGVALHDPGSFALIGYVAIGGPPGDVAFGASGDIYAPDTDGFTLTRIGRAPWQLTAIPGIVYGNEVAVDSRRDAVFISNRDVGGQGALTRIAADGSVRRVITGQTAEGLALDGDRGMIYVGNVNDNAVAQVDTGSMQVIRRIRSVNRTFGIALDANRQRLYVVSNTSPGMAGGSGYVAAIDLRPENAPIAGRSASMTFPLGVALDDERNRLYVTDEAANTVAVLNGKTLRAVRPPLHTCRTPWRPRIYAERLYIPCARANRVDVFDLRTLRRAKGAPFLTGGFPLSVALWP